MGLSIADPALDEFTFIFIRSDQSLSRVRPFATPWIAARQASLSITNSQSSLRLTSIESVMCLLAHGMLQVKKQGGGRRVQDGEHMYACGGFILIFDKTITIM